MLSSVASSDSQREGHVAKRIRGQRATHRVAGQPARVRQSTPSSPAIASSAPAVDIDAAIDDVMMAETELAIAEPVVPSTPVGRPRRTVKVKQDSLQARIAAENIYVRDDLRRIGMVSGILFAALAVAWFVFVFLDVLGLY
jgi:hypothetical protein